MYEYKVHLRLHNKRNIVDYVHAENDTDARYKAFKYAIPLYKKARPEFLGVERTRKLKKVLNQWV